MLNIECEELRAKPDQQIDALWEGFPEDSILLTPEALGRINPQYREFSRREDIHSLVVAKEAVSGELQGGWDKSLVLFQGPPAAGKDILLRAMEHLLPGHIRTILTDTTRELRGTDVHGERYRYLDRAAFLNGVQSHSYIEHVELEDGHLYGTTKEELMQALLAPGELVIGRVEPRGAKHIKEWMVSEWSQEQAPVPVIEVFLLPMSTLSQLRERMEKRGESAEARYTRTKRELYLGGCTDVLILNPHDPQGFPRLAGEATYYLFTGLVGLERRAVEFLNVSFWEEVVSSANG